MNNPEPLDLEILKKSNSIRLGKDAILLDLDVSPNSAQPGIKGYNRWRDRIMVKVRSHARRGQANTELLMLLSSIFNIDKKQLNIIKGQYSEQKTIELSGIDKKQVIYRIIEAFDE